MFPADVEGERWLFVCFPVLISRLPYPFKRPFPDSLRDFTEAKEEAGRERRLMEKA